MLGLGLGLWSGQPVAASGGTTAVTLNSTSGVNKNSGITLTNGNLTAVDNVTTDEEFVRALRECSSGAVQFEVTLNTFGSSKFSIAVEDGTVDFSTALTDSNVPGGSSHASAGYNAIYTGGTMYFVTGGGASGSVAMSPAVGDKFTVKIDKGAGTLALLYNGTQIDSKTSLSFTHWYAAIGLFGTQATVNFAGPFTYGANSAY